MVASMHRVQALFAFAKYYKDPIMAREAVLAIMASCVLDQNSLGKVSNISIGSGGIRFASLLAKGHIPISRKIVRLMAPDRNQAPRWPILNHIDARFEASFIDRHIFSK